MSTYKNLDPSTGELIAEIPVTTDAELTAKVARARAAQAGWAARGFDERAALITKAGEALSARSEELAELITREMGKPHAEALGEVSFWGKRIPTELEEVRRSLEPEVVRTDTSETRIEREPHGIVAAITPWNFPVGMPLSVLVPALATGNTVVFKPSELVPLSGERLHEILTGVLPDGVFELVHGEGDVGAKLVDADVDMIAFVGSRDTGMHIMQSASRGLKRLVLELGGNDPMLVFADADLEAAAECATRHSLRNTGQVCCSVERVYVDEKVADEFEKLVVAKAREWKHGSGFDETSKMGPLVSEEQRAKVVVQVDDAVQHGARLLTGGQRPDDAGYFYPATVIADAPADSRLSREETFGPVVSLSRFDGDETEAIRLANDTPYGLGANVWTADAQRGMRIARGIKAGQVGVNKYLPDAPGLPWVGARQSGFGFIGGVEGHKHFTVPKSIGYPI